MGANLGDTRDELAPTLSVCRFNVSVKNPNSIALRPESYTGEPYNNVKLISLPNQRMHICAVACSKGLVVQTAEWKDKKVESTTRTMKAN